MSEGQGVRMETEMEMGMEKRGTARRTKIKNRGL
jgi:hypothetical protein